MAYAFASIIPGHTYVANTAASNPENIANKAVEVYNRSCGSEPIILLGQSRGAATVVQALRILEEKHPNVEVDLVFTLGMVPFNQREDFGVYNNKRSNVTRHINIRSEKGIADFFGSPVGIPERMVSGSEEWVVIGTIHTTLDDRTLIIDGQQVANPVWSIVKDAILEVVHTRR